MNYLFTSESVSQGHPDKIADQISDAVLDYCLREDPFCKVACETLVSNGLIMLAGEVTTTTSIHFQDIVRDTIKEIGYIDPSLGLDFRSCAVVMVINKQSPDIALGVEEQTNPFKQQGAGDQGLMFGYACSETAEYMPLPIMLSHKILKHLLEARQSNRYPYLRPDAKSQVTVEYSKDHVPKRIHTIVLSTQHDEKIDSNTLEKQMKELIQEVCPKELLDDNTIFYINPTGRFVVGGPQADTGLTGRKIIVDTYGGVGRHGGGAFSGKDPSKVDRSGAYMARYIAKHIVAAGLAKRCEVQISYAIGIPHPISIRVDTSETHTIKEEIISAAIPLVFDLTPKGIIEMLNLRRPIYKKTAWGGHFGREEEEFTWEKLDKIDTLLQAVKQISFCAS